MPPPRMVLVLSLMGFFSGELQVFSLSRQRRFSLTQEVPFDMATTSFDDQYQGCEDEMEAKVGELHHMEIANSVYSKTWQDATAQWNDMKSSVSVPEGFKPDYAIAALAYTQSKDSLYKNLNTAVRKAGESENYYLQNFHFKAIHFLLTRALQVLQPNYNPKCRTTYRGVRGIRFITELSTKVRFGYFASSSLNKTVANIYGTDTFFTIKTCYGAFIKEFSFYPEEEEVLIPPYELFQVEAINEESYGIEVNLSSDGTSSKYNCVYVKGAGVSYLYVKGQMPFLLWGFLLIAGALGSPDFFL